MLIVAKHNIQTLIYMYKIIIIFQFLVMNLMIKYSVHKRFIIKKISALLSYKILSATVSNFNLKQSLTPIRPIIKSVQQHSGDSSGTPFVKSRHNAQSSRLCSLPHHSFININQTLYSRAVARG